jgi:hypothetical protein
MRTLMTAKPGALVLVIVCGTLQGCFWSTYSGGRDESIGVGAMSGYVVVTRTDMTQDQAIAEAKKVLEAWAPLDASSSPTKLVTKYKAVRDKSGMWLLPTPFIAGFGTYKSGPAAMFSVTAELVTANSLTIDIRVLGKPVQVIDHPEATATREQIIAMELGIRDPMIKDLRKRVGPPEPNEVGEK